MKIDFGTVLFDNEIIRFSSTDYGKWELRFQDVKVIGEYTNQDGPTAEDHFLVLVDCHKRAFEVPFSADGFNDFLGAICEKLKCELKPKLQSNTDFASRVLFPEELAGSPFFEFRDIPPKSILDKISGLFGIGKTEISLSDSVEKELHARDKKGSIQ